MADADVGTEVRDVVTDRGLPDGAVRCDNDEGCDDGVRCTRDVCDDSGFCQHPVDVALCDDGVFCNGVELCDPLVGDPVTGCAPGLPNTCTDDDVCTIDMCDEEAKTCRVRPRDFDEDGEADWHCEGGTDCDDRNPLRGSLSTEVCEDGVDNDCDETVDEAECGRPMHDTCDETLDISAGGVFTLRTDGAGADYAQSCAGIGRRDLALTFTIEEARSVSIRAEGEGQTAVGIRTTCTTQESELDCTSGFPAFARVRSLEAGTYFVIVSDTRVGELVLTVEFGEPVPPPENETCATPTDVSAGGAFGGSTVDVADDLMTTCGFSASPDLTYTFTTDSVRDVVISAIAETGDTMSWSLRSDCAAEASEVRCTRGSPANSRVYSLAAGTYFIVLEGSSFRESDFTLDVRFEEPTSAPAGDTCADPIVIPLNTTVAGTLADKQDDHETSCGFFYDEAVYSFVLGARSDVTVSAEGSGAFLFTSVRDMCALESAELRCVSGSMPRSRLRNLAPGTYYVLVESFRGAPFQLSVEATPPTVAVPVTGNDNCETAYVVTEAGGLFAGDTTILLADLETSTCGSTAGSNDAVFELTLTGNRRVVATTEGSTFDTVLHVHREMCVSGDELYCDDDGGAGSTSLISEILTAGTYYFVVDGFGTASTGAYTFELTTMPL